MGRARRGECCRGNRKARVGRRRPGKDRGGGGDNGWVREIGCRPPKGAGQGQDCVKRGL